MKNTIFKNMTSQSIDKTAIKNFAVYARNKLINDIKNKAAMIGVTESGIQKPLSTSTGNLQLFDIGIQEPYRIEGKAIEQRNGLIRELDNRTQGSSYSIAYETLIEEVAYTWFNRIIAIRFMEVNNYMPDRMRVLSSGVDGINEPEFITHVFESSFEFSAKEKEYIIDLKTDGSNLAMDELFQYLFIKQCNALNSNLPELFEKTNDYTELLLSVSYNDIEGVIYKLVHDVPEANFDVNSDNGNGQVEIIGWLYQFYNTEPKATVFGRPKSKKIEKQDIPAATQLFTPEWIVKYMVENSLGRLWIEKLLANGDTRTEKQIGNDFGWEYYLPEADQDESVRKQLKILRNERKNLSIEEIRFLDPAMGSFHIGIYAFDVYMQLYESEGYTTREAAKLIIEKNLHGLEIDKRATQLSYFTSIMQARKYNRRILERGLQPNVYEIPESNHINRTHLTYLGNDIRNKEEWDRLNLQLVSLLNTFIDAKEYGSLMNISDDYDFSQLRGFILSHPVDSQLSLLETVGLEDTQIELINIINVAETMSRKYDVVITNPPYMSSSGMDKKLSDFAKKYYTISKSDLFAMFIEKCKNYTIENGYFAMITQHAWMFLSSYEKLRNRLLLNTLVNMAHLGTRAFEEIGGEVVQTTTFVYLNKIVSNYTGNYIKLTDFDTQSKKEAAYLDLLKGDKKTYLYETNQMDFLGIPGKPIAYWLSASTISHFQNTKLLGEFVPLKTGLTTGDNHQFLRHWYEVDKNSIGEKWFPLNKGGDFRKWYGNNHYVINWEENGKEIKGFKGSTIRNEKYYFKEGVTWSKLAGGNLSARYSSDAHMFDAVGLTGFPEGDISLEYLLSFLCSKVANLFAKILNPTISITVGTLSKIPFIFDQAKQVEIDKLATKNIALAKWDWDSDETSSDFSKHPFIIYKDNKKKLHDINLNWERVKEYNYITMKDNEKKLNDIFIKMYDLCKEIDSEIEVKEITLRQTNKEEDIRSFLSYFVGVAFGRYFLEENRLSSAEENVIDDVNSRKNSVILISSDDIFLTDITTQFIEFVSKCYSRETLEENLKFIANILNPIGSEPKEVIRNYFLKEFFQDHVKKYQKRPIYWLYDSGKQNGFKALVYMHCYDKDTTGKVRVDYLHPVQRAYERTIVNLQDDIASSKDAKESTKLQKQLEKVTKQLKECRDYDERLGHMALERVAINLDDGVKVNYDKVQTDSKGKFHQILAKIK